VGRPTRQLSRAPQRHDGTNRQARRLQLRLDLNVNRSSARRAMRSVVTEVGRPLEWEQLRKRRDMPARDDDPRPRICRADLAN